MAVVDAIYARSPDRVPATLETCTCPVCMTPETLADIIATPVRALTAHHLDEYRNSAHGVPVNPDDLRAMLPRYLDMIAQDQWFDTVGVGVDLLRFGDGRGTHAPLFDAQTEALLNKWAHLMILHTGTAEAVDEDTAYGVHNLVEVLLVGGWPVPIVTGALDALFASEHGAIPLTTFLARLGESLCHNEHFDMWALDRYRSEAIPEFVDWLNAFLNGSAAQALLLSPPVLAKPWADPLVMIGGTITRATFCAA